VVRSGTRNFEHMKHQSGSYHSVRKLQIPWGVKRRREAQNRNEKTKEPSGEDEGESTSTEWGICGGERQAVDLAKGFQVARTEYVEDQNRGSLKHNTRDGGCLGKHSGRKRETGGKRNRVDVLLDVPQREGGGIREKGSEHIGFAGEPGKWGHTSTKGVLCKSGPQRVLRIHFQRKGIGRIKKLKANKSSVVSKQRKKKYNLEACEKTKEGSVQERCFKKERTKMFVYRSCTVWGVQNGREIRGENQEPA